MEDARAAGGGNEVKGYAWVARSLLGRFAVAMQAFGQAPCPDGKRGSIGQLSRNLAENAADTLFFRGENVGQRATGPESVTNSLRGAALGAWLPDFCG
jgi:hypothetical protein